MDDEAAAAWEQAAEEIGDADLSTEEGRREVLRAYGRARRVEREARTRRRLRGWSRR